MTPHHPHLLSRRDDGGNYDPDRISATVSEVTSKVDAQLPASLRHLDVRVLTRAALAGMAPEDLHRIRTDVLAKLVLACTEAASSRTPGSATILLPPAISVAGSALTIITDDMPFLVDSVSAELERHGLIIHSVMHPQVRVARDSSGALKAVQGHSEGEADDRIAESWMRFVIDEVDQDEADTLLADIAKVLSDVRNVVDDWAAMEQRALTLAEELTTAPPAHCDRDDVRATADFLTWLTRDNFTFLGARDYDLVEGEPHQLRAVAGSGLGILQTEMSLPAKALPAHDGSIPGTNALILVTKINRPSPVHRPSLLDYIGVKRYDEEGRVIGERRFLGLFTRAAYQQSVRQVPIIADKVTTALERTGFDPEGRLGKDLLSVLEEYPRDELFQIEREQLAEVAASIVYLHHRRSTRVFVRRDPYGRFASCLVYTPRDRYSRRVHDRLNQLMQTAFGGEDIASSARVTASPLAQIHMTVWGRNRALVPDVDGAWLASRISEITRSFTEDVRSLLAAHPQELPAGAKAILDGFPTDYQDDTPAAMAIEDACEFAAVFASTSGQVRARLMRRAYEDGWQLRLYSPRELTLTEMLPILTDFGVQVIDEQWYHLEDHDAYLHCLGITGPFSGDEDEALRFDTAVEQVVAGAVMSDGFNQLVLTAGLRIDEVMVLRAITSYAKQIGVVYSKRYFVDTLTAYPQLARALFNLFAARFAPELPDLTFDDDLNGIDLAPLGEIDIDDARRQLVSRQAATIIRACDDVASLDQDRIIRILVSILLAMVRTNFYQYDTTIEVLACKLVPKLIDQMPQPHPEYEIWVHGPKVEGVHLRFGKVARGGLRWSDRREDFRTEVLGLVKAQMVKNAVIVPTGSKGGFVALDLPDPNEDRAAWLQAGTDAYVQFISALLDITDNRASDGSILAPEAAVRWDEDDPYLVVAADKGTAAFSDTANQVARTHEFWLDDAFASGGSAGYDHKKMGITARGAWESVKRHFRELNHDVAAQDFTVVGIGDMSGDVFGNGMLLSNHIRLVAAFDHRHIFIDPAPDAASSYRERKRLFELPRSSWDDYDRSLISTGGGVFSRSLKTVPITPEIRQVLDLDDEARELTPNELIRAVLTAPVDLLWNGGIGTYVRSSSEDDREVGDRANDPIRVTGSDLRCRVVGEGGNLGFTQLGRIEAAQCGVHLNTDAIDNSGGVDSSDLEVNIKIALQPIVARGELSMGQRNDLLADMTDEVAALVLRQNYEQNVLLGNARALEATMIGAHMRLMQLLEESGELDRELEFLPSDSQMQKRAEAGRGLVTPEFAVLVAYAKMHLKAELLATELPDEPWTNTLVADHFPSQLSERYARELAEHRLRREIVVTELANAIINRGGITFVSRAMDETGAAAIQIARAFAVAREVFNLRDFVAQVEATDGQVATEVQSELYLAFRRMLDTAVRWLIHNRPSGIDVERDITQYATRVQQLVGHGADLFGETFQAQLQQRVATLTA
ncbi:MAG: NAD-glutamate dehydrogenase, partial [Bowdeniella nasicola]|nr:NAD-glutamate dehydrogenase [Bowdeniella nasicola]